MDLNYPVIYIDYFHDYIYVEGEPVHISKFSSSVSSFRLNSIFDSSVTTYTRTHDGYIKGNYINYIERNIFGNQVVFKNEAGKYITGFKNKCYIIQEIGWDGGKPGTVYYVVKWKNGVVKYFDRSKKVGYVFREKINTEYFEIDGILTKRFRMMQNLKNLPLRIPLKKSPKDHILTLFML